MRSLAQHRNSNISFFRTLEQYSEFEKWQVKKILEAEKNFNHLRRLNSYSAITFIINKMEYSKEKIDNLEKEIQSIKNTIQKYQQINIDEPKPISKDNNTIIDIETEKNNLIPYKQFEPDNQTVYCQCCNFTNSNHNAAKLIFEMILIVLNISSVCGLCYIIFMR